MTHKEAPGSHLNLVGAHSPGDLASRPCGVVLADEINKYPASAGEEGDPLKLVEERASTYLNVNRGKLVRTCSPTVKGACRIGKEYEASDQRRCFVAWFKPSGDLWELTDNCTIYSPMALPGGANKMTLGTQGITFAQDSAGGTTTTLTLIRPEFLIPVGHAGVVTDGAGNIVSNPGPAQPVAPDYLQGSPGAGGLVGHA